MAAEKVDILKRQISMDNALFVLLCHSIVSTMIYRMYSKIINGVIYRKTYHAPNCRAQCLCGPCNFSTSRFVRRSYSQSSAAPSSPIFHDPIASVLPEVCFKDLTHKKPIRFSKKERQFQICSSKIEK